MRESVPAVPPPGDWTPPSHLGARLGADGRCSFRVWAPFADTVELELESVGSSSRHALQRESRGYHALTVTDVAEGTRYRFRVDGTSLPDPASRWQPDGVHGASAVLATDADWHDPTWRGVPLEQYVLYELHVGTFTTEGTFDAAAERLPALKDLGVTAIELLPIAEFPGSRNWGYDGVAPFAAQSSYGGPHGLRRFVAAAHAAGLAVVLDVVYNHLGPEGNYLSKFGPYFTDRYRTPWGDALNFDGAYSDEVRAFFIASALQWIDEFHVDGLRLDAVHAIFDASAHPFLRELAETVRARAAALDREVVLIAESDLGDPRMIRPPEQGGMHMHAQWLDDFHHALHALLTGERDGYYIDFGDVAHLARAFRQGFVYAGDFSTFRARRHGQRADGSTAAQFVVFAQNHDQVGNRLAGDRLSTLLDHEQLKLQAATVLLSPFTPLLFMGEEYGERSPFPYFVSHTEPELVAAVRAGRAAEFETFGWASEPPDPQAEATRSAAVLRWADRETGAHGDLLRLHRDLLALRRRHQAVLTRYRHLETRHGSAAGGAELLQVLRNGADEAALLVLNFGSREATPRLPDGRWEVVVHTDSVRYGGATPEGRARADKVAPHSATLLLRTAP